MNLFDNKNNFSFNRDLVSELIYGNNDSLIPKVSIMIPTYRRPHLLKKAISSALSQDTDIPFEVVVIDNEQDKKFAGQVDSIVCNFQNKNLFLYRNQKNLGMFGNWNRCFELARSPWVSILNDDDYLLPWFIQTVESFLKKNKNVSLIQTKVITELSLKKKKYIEFRPKKISSKKLLFRRLILGNTFFGSLGVLYSKEDAIKHGGFNSEAFPVSDYLYHLSMLKDGCNALTVNSTCSVYCMQESASQNSAILSEFVIVQDLLLKEARSIFKIRRLLLEIYRRAWVISTCYSMNKAWKTSVNTSYVEEKTNVRLSKNIVRTTLARIIKKGLYILLYL
jgi:glycosyltransferase involved in cell wall biosynthesis